MTYPRKRAVFLDRDGVLNLAVVRNGRPYPPASPEELTIVPDASDALSRIRKLDFVLFVATNQPDVARGTQAQSVVEAMNTLLLDNLPLDGVYVCYHDDGDSCECRKPKSGLLGRAAAEHNIDLQKSYMIGDRWRDIECGRGAGCTTILVDRDYEEHLRQEPHFRVRTLSAAADVISSLERKEVEYD